MAMDDKELGPYEIFEIYRKEWILLYAELLPMRHTDGPLLPSFVMPMDTMEVFFIKVACLTGGDLE
ncbi:unnamed protein product [Urochloa humidicola]